MVGVRFMTIALSFIAVSVSAAPPDPSPFSEVTAFDLLGRPLRVESTDNFNPAGYEMTVTEYVYDGLSITGGFGSEIEVDRPGTWIGDLVFSVSVIDVQPIWTKGGSIRTFVQCRGGPRPMAQTVHHMIAEETRLGLYDPRFYANYGVRLSTLRDKLGALIESHKKDGRPVAERLIPGDDVLE